MQKKLEELGINPESTEAVRIANTTKDVNVDTAQKVLRMIDTFEEDEDVQNVFHNMEMTDELMQELSK